MDSSAEFASLVATHRRLMEKYEPNRCSLPTETSTRHSTTPSNSTSEPARRRVEGTPWIDMAHATTPRKLPYLTSETLEPRCCPRCHYSMEPKSLDVLSTPFPKNIPESNKGMVPSFATDGVVGINHMIQLQLASMEYARLLSALRTGSCLPPPFYHDQHVRPYVIDPLSGRQEDPTSKVQNKRKDCESEADAASIHRTIPVKRTRLVWTKELHERFVEAVEKLGLDKAVPKAILELMGVEGLTRENVASHLQKYRLQLVQNQPDKRNNTTLPNKEKNSEAPSSVAQGSSAFTESESTESVTHNTGDSSTTAMPEQK